MHRSAGLKRLETTAATQPSPRVRHCLSRLLTAREYAIDLDRDVWDFAVEMKSLAAGGLTNCDLRWLLCKGIVQHAVELPATEECIRSFEHSGALTFSELSCFVLTDEGVEFAEEHNRPGQELPPLTEDELVVGLVQRLLSGHTEFMATGNGRTAEGRSTNGQSHQNGESDEPGAQTMTSAPEPSQPIAPFWDRDRHELRVGDEIVKVFRLPSPNQEAVLTAFQEDEWPARIDDPLPPVPEMEPKRRLHDTIKSLNRNQKKRLIRFMGDGTGEGVLWEFISTTPK